MPTATATATNGYIIIQDADTLAEIADKRQTSGRCPTCAAAAFDPCTTAAGAARRRIHKARAMEHAEWLSYMCELGEAERAGAGAAAIAAVKERYGMPWPVPHGPDRPRV